MKIPLPVCTFQSLHVLYEAAHVFVRTATGMHLFPCFCALTDFIEFFFSFVIRVETIQNTEQDFVSCILRRYQKYIYIYLRAVKMSICGRIKRCQTEGLSHKKINKLI